MSDGLQAHVPAAADGPDVPRPDRRRDSSDLGREIERVKADMERSIQLAGLRNDPLMPLLRTLATSLGLQWRLHDQSVGHCRDVSERLDQQLADTIKQGEQALETRRVAIVEALAPELAKLTAKSVRTWNRTVTLRLALTFGGVAVALAFGVGMAGYGAGWQAGRNAAAEASGSLAAAARQAGPGAEDALARMVRANNLEEAWANCQKLATTEKGGRRVCMMPMWADPGAQPPKS